MKPGIYDISNEEYHQSVGISRSGLMKFKKSPLHYWYDYLYENKPPENQTSYHYFGNTVHTYVLENKEFHHRYYVWPDEQINLRTKKGKQRYKELQELSEGRYIVTKTDYEKILNMAEALRINPQIKELIDAGRYEKSIYWEDPDTQVLCKCRPDILHNNMVCDLKTAKDASFYAFQRDLYKYGYHIQAAMIKEGLHHACNIKIDDFIFIVVEKEPPYATAVYVLDQISLNHGREEFKYLIKQFKKCSDENCWPSYNVREISLPNYAFYLAE